MAIGIHLWTTQAEGGNWGNLVIAIDPSMLGDEAAFRWGFSCLSARLNLPRLIV